MIYKRCAMVKHKLFSSSCARALLFIVLHIERFIVPMNVARAPIMKKREREKITFCFTYSLIVQTVVLIVIPEQRDD